MINTTPLKTYLKAQAAICAGNNNQALELLTQSIGADNPSEFIKENLVKLVKEPNDAILTMVIDQARGERYGK